MMFSLLKKSYKWLGLAIITVILAITPAVIAQSTTSTIPLAKINWLQ
ncbi:MAG: undecaprenyl-diphosphatase, partial [Microcystis panniformis]